MRKLTTILLVFLLLTLSISIGFADVDLSGMSFDELVALKDKINLAIWNSQEWQEVTVPQGVWRIGVDIPAGHWTIRMVEEGWTSWCGLTYCSELDETGLKGKKSGTYHYQQLSRPGKDYPAPEQIDIELKDGMYLVITESDVVFTPFSGKPDLGFK